VVMIFVGAGSDALPRSPRSSVSFVYAQYTPASVFANEVRSVHGGIQKSGAPHNFIRQLWFSPIQTRFVAFFCKVDKSRAHPQNRK